MAACAAPLVGWLAREAFGFVGTAEVGPDSAINAAKARSLSSALLVFTALTWTLCALLFTPLHFTYPRDRRRAEVAAAEALAEAAAAQDLLATAGIELAAVGQGHGGAGDEKHEAAAAAAADDSAADWIR